MIGRLRGRAALLGLALLFAYGWSEATFGPSQTYGTPNEVPVEPLRVAAAIQLVNGALLCFAVALLGLRARTLSGARRLERVGTALGLLAVALLLVGSALWWPIILLRVGDRFGLVAGAPVALGMLALFGSWILLGLHELREDGLPSWARPIPLALLGLALILFYLLSTRSPWTLIAAVFAPFALGWIALAYVMDSRGRTLITGQ